MKTIVDKSHVEYLLFQLLRNVDKNVDKNDICDYILKLRNENNNDNAYWSSLQNDMLLRDKNDYAFVAITSNTQREYVFVYNSFFDYIKCIYLHTTKFNI